MYSKEVLYNLPPDILYSRYKNYEIISGIQYANKYYKCDAWILSHSSATDIRVRGKACGIWQARGGD